MIAQLTLLVGQRRHSGRHSDRPMDAIGRPKEAQWSPQLSFNGHYWSAKGGTVVTTVIVQWTLLVGLRRQNDGTREAEVSLKSIHNVYSSTHVTGRPIRGSRRRL